MATLKIDADQKNVPVDSRVVIRPRSVLGLKYVELHRGSSERVLREGDTLPVARASIPVELDEFQNMFDEYTRVGIQRNLRRLRRRLRVARRVAEPRRSRRRRASSRHLEPVMRVLADKDTQIGRFFRELDDFTSTVSPVADRYAHGFTAGADTFEAWSRYPAQLGSTIEKSAPTMDVGIRSLRVQRPFLRALRDTSARRSRTPRASCRATLPRITPALRAGIPVLRRSPEVNDDLRDTFGALDGLMRDPATGVAFRGLGRHDVAT